MIFITPKCFAIWCKQLWAKRNFTQSLRPEYLHYILTENGDIWVEMQYCIKDTENKLPLSSSLNFLMSTWQKFCFIIPHSLYSKAIEGSLVKIWSKKDIIDLEWVIEHILSSSISELQDCCQILAFLRDMKKYHSFLKCIL